MDRNAKRLDAERLMLFLTVIGVAIAFFASSGLFAARRHRQFFEAWPAISDDEFIAQCSPGTRRETALRVCQIVSEQLGIPYERIHPDQHFLDDLDCC